MSSSSSSSSSAQPSLQWIQPFLESIPINTEQEFTILGENCEGLEWVTSPAGTPQNGTGLSFTTKWADSGMARQVVAILGNVFLQAHVNVVKIGSFFSSGGGNVPPILHVLRGQSIVFVVSIDPLDAKWPVGKPVWSHGVPDPSPLWPALPFFKAQEVTFPISGETTVTVECGNTKSVTVKVGDLATRFAQGNLRPGVGASRTVTTTATVERLAGGDALTVNLSTTNPRATVSPASFVLPAGSTLKTQQVTVTGVSLSAADQDTTLLASVAGVTNGTASITVVEPKRYDIARTAQSGAWKLREGIPSTVVWSSIVWIRVLDQFGQPTSKAFEGAQIQERVKPPGATSFLGLQGLDQALLPQNWSPLGATGFVDDVVRGMAEFPRNATGESLADGIVRGTVSYPRDFGIPDPQRNVFEMKFFVDGNELDGILVRIRSTSNNVETITNEILP